MNNYNLIGLQNFIFHNYKSPLVKEDGWNRNEVYVEGMETRYTDMCLFRDLDNLTYKVHDKVMEKLADKIADDVMDRILRQIDENKQDKCNLEEENEELKRDKEDLIFIINQRAKCMCEDKETITKAKDIIKGLMILAEMDDREYEEAYKQAEQFLKDN